MGTSGQSNSPSIIEKAPVRLFVSRCDEPGSKNITAIIGMKKVDGDILFVSPAYAPPLRIPCPQCGKILYQKRNGRCSECGTRVSAHVEAVRDREERIEKVVAVIGTALVVLVLMLAGGVGLFEAY